MGKPQKISLKEAANLIQDGDFLAFSGFTIWRRPMALIYEMVRQGKKDLHLFEVNGGTHTEVLAGAGAIKMWESCWVGHELYGKLGEGVARGQVEGTILVEDYSHGQMVARLLAGAYGLPFFPTALSMGTDILNPKFDMLGKAGLRDGSNPKIPLKKYDTIKDPMYDMGEILLMPAANPDWALVYASQVGDEGTVRVFSQTYVDPEVIKAADKVIDFDFCSIKLGLSTTSAQGVATIFITQILYLLFISYIAQKTFRKRIRIQASHIILVLKPVLKILYSDFSLPVL
jgi:glutaconate CoA-transferase subunit A